MHLADGERVVMAGVMQHIEEAGVHSGDSACVLPPVQDQPISPEHHSRLYRAIGHSPWASAG